MSPLAEEKNQSMFCDFVAQVCRLNTQFTLHLRSFPQSLMKCSIFAEMLLILTCIGTGAVGPLVISVEGMVL